MNGEMITKQASRLFLIAITTILVTMAWMSAPADAWTRAEIKELEEVNVTYYEPGYKFKVGTKCFWSTNFPEGMKVSASESDQKKGIYDVILNIRPIGNIYTDGSNLFMVAIDAEDYSEPVIVILNMKSYKAETYYFYAESNSYVPSFCNLYNGYFYISTDGGLYKFDLTQNRMEKVSTAYFHRHSSTGRYMYGDEKGTLKIYDAKEGKIIKNIECEKWQIIKGKIYFSRFDGDSIKVYEASSAGASAKRILTKSKIYGGKYYWNSIYIEKITTNYIYYVMEHDYYDYDYDYDSAGYRFDKNTKKSTKLKSETFYKYTGNYFGEKAPWVPM